MTVVVLYLPKGLTLFDTGFFEPSVMVGGGGGGGEDEGPPS